jgi:hypothetical protein
MQSRAPLAARTARRPPAVSRSSAPQATTLGGCRSKALAPPRPVAAAAAATAVADAPSCADPASLLAAAARPPTQGKLRAVVYGGGLAGLTTARVLAESFDEVLLLERDALADAASPSDALAPDAAAAAADPAAAAAHARRGVPQFRQPHQLLARGLEELERLFPGLTDDLYASGAAEVAVPGGYSVYDDRVGQLAHTHASVLLVGSTRALLERAVRARLTRGLDAGEEEGEEGTRGGARGPACRARVTVVPGAVVTGWVMAEGDPSRVAGVSARPAGAPPSSASPVEVRGDLVVDASGRGSKAPEWLAAAGFSAPETTTVSAGTVYLTATYRVPPGALPCALNPAAGNASADPAAIAAFEAQRAARRRARAEEAEAAAAGAPSSPSPSPPSPPSPPPERTPGYGIMCYTSFPRTRSSILMPVENGLHQLICCAKMEDLPAVAEEDGGAATDAGVFAFCESLPDGGRTIRALRAAQRVGDITTYRRTENFRRRYEKLVDGGAAAAAGGAAPKPSLPRGWVALGDAAVAFNPVFGQGISVGVMQAKKLGELVRAALLDGGSGGGGAAAAAARSAAVASVGAPFFSALPAVVEVPWALAAGTDAPFAGFEQPPLERALNAYFLAVMRLAKDDPGAYDDLIASVHMTKPTAALFHPRYALRVAARELAAAARRALGLDGASAGAGGDGQASASASAR